VRPAPSSIWADRAARLRQWRSFTRGFQGRRRSDGAAKRAGCRPYQYPVDDFPGAPAAPARGRHRQWTTHPSGAVDQPPPPPELDGDDVPRPRRGGGARSFTTDLTAYQVVPGRHGVMRVLTSGRRFDAAADCASPRRTAATRPTCHWTTCSTARPSPRLRRATRWSPSTVGRPPCSCPTCNLWNSAKWGATCLSSTD